MFQKPLSLIGNNSFNIRRLQNLTASDIKIKPAVNQVELNYWLPQPELVKWSRENGIILEAYSPLGGAKTVSKTLNLPIVGLVTLFLVFAC